MPNPRQQDHRLNKDELVTYTYSVVLVKLQTMLMIVMVVVVVLLAKVMR